MLSGQPAAPPPQPLPPPAVIDIVSDDEEDAAGSDAEFDYEEGDDAAAADDDDCPVVPGAVSGARLLWGTVASLAVGETVILLHPLSLRRCFNTDGKGASAK